MNSEFLRDLSFWRRNRMPVQLQTEAAECGLACLVMIAAYWGCSIDLATMRRRHPISAKGANLKLLMATASRIGFRPRAVKLSIEYVKDLRLPCILHWDLNHFVALKEVKSEYVVIHDPAVGVRRMGLELFGQHFTGVALELQVTAEFKTESAHTRFSLRSLMGRVVGLNRGLFHLTLLAAALQICALIAPFYLQWIVDEALLAGDRNLVLVLSVGFLGLAILQAGISAIRSWATTVFATDLNMQWLANAFSHLLKLPISYFERRHTGDVVSRFSSINEIQHSITTQFVQSAIDGLFVIATLIVMAIYSTTLTLVTVFAVLLFTSIRLAVFPQMRNATAEQIIHTAKQETYFLETVRGIQSVRVCGQEDGRLFRWLNALTDQFNASLCIARLRVAHQTANTLIFNAERIIVVWLGAFAVLDGRFSVGMLFAYLSYKDQFSQRTAALVDNFFEWKTLRVHGERVADIVFAEVEKSAEIMEPDLCDLLPTIEMRNVGFRFSETESFVVHDFSLKISEGECVAITGQSGCGKTTIVKLILGLLEATEGEIFVGGLALSCMNLSGYRAIVGTVMQDDTLFVGSISENISCFDSTPDMEWIFECARLSSIHSEIMALPMGYNTLVGDIGSGFSGGQRQRILLARALYRRPRILILDEATSHLDVSNERAVNSAIKGLNLTRILIAHRPETLAMADRVVVMAQGRVVDVIDQRQAQSCISSPLNLLAEKTTPQVA